jgi:hypothetical protein
MASKPNKTFSISSGGFPTDAASVLVDMLRGTVPFEKWKAIHAALELITYMMSYAADAYSVKAVKAPKASKKLIADTLEKAMLNKPGTVKATSFSVPAWLLPILIKMLLKWVENNYPPKGDKNEKKG